MPATPEVLQGRSFAKRVPLAAPVDALDLTVGDTTTFAALEAREDDPTATRTTLATTTATREVLAE